MIQPAVQLRRAKTDVNAETTSLDFFRQTAEFPTTSLCLLGVRVLVVTWGSSSHQKAQLLTTSSSFGD